ncbi:HD-GYP domain-containing protein [Clostridium sp.]|uniref:HD-GYP domain-containing protein n=1 Tax=Clostridium sp. TaxID=1506 RepID=UPI0026239DA9|nr:HD-GYP domain-containing protein [Clostridium sp.]
MVEQRVLVTNCKTGMILAEDIIYNGSKLASKNTVLNTYIIDKLISLGEYSICVYIPKNYDKVDESNSILESFKRDYEEDIKQVQKIISELMMTSNINVNDVLKISKSVIRYLEEPGVIIECLNSLKNADEYTYTHCINVAIYSMLIAKWMNLSLESIQEVIQSALLHDIGKTRIPNEILNKPGKLTSEEFNEIKKHTTWGYYLINQYSNLNNNIKNAILMHHEKIDGSGYPLGITDKEIVLGAKIISVADTFDAMTSNRVYKKGTTPFKAFLMFMTEGVKYYDTSAIFALLDNISSYYIGMKVTLEDGRTGEIMYIPPNDVLSPIVQVEDELIDFSRKVDLSITSVYV